MTADRRSWLAGMLAWLAVPLPAEAQAKVFRIGLLGGLSPASPEAAHVWGGLFEGLRELGYVEGRNLAIESRFYGDRVEQLPGLASELVRLKVDVIVAGVQPAPEEARRATSTIPIVMTNHGNPVGSALVASLARPAGNVTGMSLVTSELRGKHLQLLKELVPGLERTAVLVNPTVPTQPTDLKALEAAAGVLKVRLHVVEARSPEQFAEAFALAAKVRAQGLVVLGGSVHFAHRTQIANLAAANRLPAIYPAREFAEAGGLMAYGADLRDTFRRAAAYVDKILKGAKPGDLPVEQPTKFELVINRKTAQALGLTIPQSLLVRAERIIE